MSTVAELLNNPESVGVWTLDSDQSTITFNNKTMWGAMKVNGVFTEFSGDGQITNSGTLFGRVDIKAASLTTKLGKRDEDLRSPTFLDVDNSPISAWSSPASNLVPMRPSSCGLISPSRAPRHQCRCGPGWRCATTARCGSPLRPP